MKALVLGGDGFCGWPTSLHLAAEGYAVTIADNLSRRAIATRLGAPSLTPIRPITERVKAAQAIGDVAFEHVDLTDSVALTQVLNRVVPDVIVHFAEQRSAPYSMLGDAERRYTVSNNVNGTNTLFSILVELGQRPHVIHLGTMGVYGYSDDLGELQDGYLDVRVAQTGRDVTIGYPANPGSIYHLTKCLDHTLMQFYAKNWGFRVTDLHQGVVWGTDTEITGSNEALINRFDYDGEYGTVLNRLLSQAAIGHPLTVYGTGGQSRAFIHIADTARCVHLAIGAPPEPGDRVQVFNQVAEVHNIGTLARAIAERTGVEVSYLENPRKEAAKNNLIVSNAGLRSLGFAPMTLADSLMDEISATVGRYEERLNRDVILSNARW